MSDGNNYNPNTWKVTLFYSRLGLPWVKKQPLWSWWLLNPITHEVESDLHNSRPGLYPLRPCFKQTDKQIRHKSTWSPLMHYRIGKGYRKCTVMLPGTICWETLGHKNIFPSPLNTTAICHWNQNWSKIDVRLMGKGLCAISNVLAAESTFSLLLVHVPRT